MTRRIYLDHAATTPILPAARAAMAEAMERWANPSSPHAEGRAARAALDRFRSDIAEALNWRHDVIFTSGASEALAIAGKCAHFPGRLIGATEHEAVAAAMGEDAVCLPVDGRGLIEREALVRALEAGPALVAIQHVNNETGVIQPLEELGASIGSAGSLLLADCAQSAGKLPLPDADFIAVSAHKLGGPPGVGALLVKDLATIAPTGGQEKGYRRGTQNLPGVAGFAAALRAGSFREAMPRLKQLRQRLEAGLPATSIAGDAPRSPAIGAYSVPGGTSEALLVKLDLACFAVSAGSACSSGSMKPSHVLAAMGISENVARSTVRISFGPETSEDEVDALVAAMKKIAARSVAA